MNYEYVKEKIEEFESWKKIKFFLKFYIFLGKIFPSFRGYDFVWTTRRLLSNYYLHFVFIARPTASCIENIKLTVLSIEEDFNKDIVNILYGFQKNSEFPKTFIIKEENFVYELISFKSKIQFKEIEEVNSRKNFTFEYMGNGTKNGSFDNDISV